MKGAEDGVFFTTKKDGDAKDFGNSLLSANIPIELLNLDDDLGDELHLRIPTDKRGQSVDVSKFLNKESKCPDCGLIRHENNPNHAPSGDSKGGQFTKGDGAGSGDDDKKDEPKAVSKSDKSADWHDERDKKRNTQNDKDTDIIPSTEIPEELRPSGENYRVEAEKARLRDKISSETEFIDTYKDRLSSDQVKGISDQIEQYKKDLDNVDVNDKKLNLPNIPMKANTHTKNTEGFIHDKSKITLQKAVKESPGTKLMSDRVKSAWNNLPDEHRNLVDNLVIKKSRAVKSRSYNGGSWNRDTKTLTLNLNSRSQDMIEHNFYHEIGHARYSDMKNKSPEKIEVFSNKVKELGLAPTFYSQGYKNAERDNDESERKYRSDMKRGGFTVNGLAEEILEKNKRNAIDLYQNEAHSELNSYVLGNLPKKKISVSPESMTKLLNAYKELHEL